MKDISTEELVFTLQLSMGDHTAANAFTDKVCLTLLNFAADKVLNETPLEKIGAGLLEQDYTVEMTDNVGDLPIDTLKVINGRQSSAPTRPGDIISMAEFRDNTARTMFKGTLYRPLIGVDVTSLEIRADAGAYSGDYDIDYVRKANKLRLSGIEDENGVEWEGADVDPEWSSQVSLLVLERAKKDGALVAKRTVDEKADEEMLIKLIRRMAS